MRERHRLRFALLWTFLALAPSWASGANLLVAASGTSSSDGRVYSITPSGNVFVFAGSIPFPEGLAVDSGGNVYVGDFNTNIRKYTPAGSLSIFATGVFPFGLAFDRTGNLFEA